MVITIEGYKRNIYKMLKFLIDKFITLITLNLRGILVISKAM